jgi:predicted transposase/invertase (TIGR01784 family)
LKLKKDIVTKDIIKEIARDISTYMLDIKLSDEITLIDKEFTRVEKRDSDIVFINGADKIVHIEIQNDHHTLMHLRMLRYYCDIQFEYPKHDITQYMIYIGKKPCYMKNKIEKENLTYKYDIIDIRDIACDELLYHNNPSAVALSILCDFKDKDKQIVVNTILKRIKELVGEDSKRYKNYLEKVTILSTNRDLEQNVKKGAKMLAVDIEKIPFYQDGKAVGLKEGIEKGIQKGIEKGTRMIAIQMLKANVDIETIHKYTNLSVQRLNELKKELG